ncbi:HAD family phosphatase [Flavobacteriaceae bacterium AU392]|nr:HAD family phosphatase [Flavobacteriaceae bacterium]RKM86117.1 HAD family phosphatase [Flavobacteriaceae bacterium AU392]
MIKTIVFDFGDVFINLDKAATVKEINRYFGSFTIDYQLVEINNAYETGNVTSEDFIKFYSDYFKTDNSQVLIEAWNAIILDFPEYRLKFIEALSKSKNYKLILLSNTNALHIERVIKNMEPARYTRFKNCFDAFYLSHEIHLRKPNNNVYEFVLNENKLIANETLFIDDTIENTKAASQLEIYTWTLHPDTDDIINLFTAKAELF